MWVYTHYVTQFCHVPHHTVYVSYGSERKQWPTLILIKPSSMFVNILRDNLYYMQFHSMIQYFATTVSALKWCMDNCDANWCSASQKVSRWYVELTRILPIQTSCNNEITSRASLQMMRCIFSPHCHSHCVKRITIHRNHQQVSSSSHNWQKQFESIQCCYLHSVQFQLSFLVNVFLLRRNEDAEAQR